MPGQGWGCREGLSTLGQRGLRSRPAPGQADPARWRPLLPLAARGGARERRPSFTPSFTQRVQSCENDSTQHVKGPARMLPASLSVLWVFSSFHFNLAAVSSCSGRGAMESKECGVLY